MPTHVDCTVFAAGFEVAGDFMIVAQKEGFQQAEVSVTVNLDEAGCHVITQEIVVVKSKRTQNEATRAIFSYALGLTYPRYECLRQLL